MGLREYHRKRDFKKTPEPKGKAKSSGSKLAFLVQKHDASHLHYDLRLEWDGVLKSWAVPKGPHLDPSQKRLAVHVEDHPLEYGKFEGTIPQGEYGGGTVMLWDRGTWEPIDDPGKGLRDGRLEFVLHGQKLHGKWMLVRRGGKEGDPDERNWFLFKVKDKYAKVGSEITKSAPLSVATGRDLEEIAAAESSAHSANKNTNGHAHRRTAHPAVGISVESKHRNIKSMTKVTSTKSIAAKRSRTKESLSLAVLLQNPAAKAARLPSSPTVELATLAKTVPSGDNWLHEVKFDGYRMLCRIVNSKARFISRNGHDWTKKFPELTKAASELPLEEALLDGEVVAVDPEGLTHFQTLQKVFQSGGTEHLLYYVFDILHLNGHNLKSVPLHERKDILQALLAQSDHPSILFSDHLEGSGRDIIEQACKMHWEGIVSKRRDSIYRPGRGMDWLKVKCSQREEFVIGGYTSPGGSRAHFGSLLVGYYDADKNLIHAGRVGTGFNDETLRSLKRKFTRLEQSDSPFTDFPQKASEGRGVHWLKPELVAEISFSNWTEEGLLRHPSFQGLREDKPAIDVIRDAPISSREVKAMEHHPSPSKGRAPRQRIKVMANSSQKPVGDNSEHHGVTLSHPEKVLYPDSQITKEDLASYYDAVSAWMLPHVVNRPLALVRCPQGQTKPCFFQKHPGEGSSEHLRKVNVSLDADPEYHLAINDAAGLTALVQMGVLEIHTWGSQVDHLEKPDRLVFDLDPDTTVGWPKVVASAHAIRELLEELGLISFVKTTGGKGLHIVVPIQPRHGWDDAKLFSHAVANFIVRNDPDQYVATMSKKARKGKIFIDYLRNGRGATSVAPYSTRSKPGATVSTPITWDELTSQVRSDHFTVKNLPSRLTKLKRDPWSDLLSTKQTISQSMLKRLS